MLAIQFLSGFNRWTFLIVVCLMTMSSWMESLADEKPTVPAVQMVALDGTAVVVTAAELQKLPRTSVEVIDQNGRTVKYTGVAVHVLLSQVNAPLGKELRGATLRCFVAVKGNDDYRVVFALCELDPEFSDRVILLADEQDGKPLDENSGPFQLIVPGEKRRARWVRQVDRIRLMESRVFDEDIPTKP